MKKLFAIILTATLLTAAAPTALFAQDTISNEAKQHILNELNRANIPNAAIAMIQDGETSYILKDSSHDTLFQIGSVAKSFTAFGVLLLEDMGLFSVNDPVSQHLPWFEVSYNGEPVPHRDITIYNLLHHTSGITSDERHFPPSMTGLTTDEFIMQLIGIELAFYPSMVHVYGNANYIILGFLIEAVYGQSYDEFMIEQVLHPLGLYNTFTDVERAYGTGRVIGGNRLRFLQPVTWNPSVTPLAIPTGFMYSDISDMARWAGIHLGAVEVNEQLARVVQRSHELNGSEMPFADFSFFYGGGWGVFPEDGRIAHNGATPGYSASVIMLPEYDTAVIVLGNLQNGALQFGDFVLSIMEGGDLNRAGIDFFTILDIVYTALTLMGIIYIALFVRTTIRLCKRLRRGERAKTKFCIKWLIDPLLSTVGLMAFYVIAPFMMSNSVEFLAMFSPASGVTALIALWIMVVYSFCICLAKAFGLQVKKIQKDEK